MYELCVWCDRVLKETDAVRYGICAECLKTLLTEDPSRCPGVRVIDGEILYSAAWLSRS
jgi:hypothetical protein